ncbi:ABC transporter permease [Bradyrhizobium sp. WSM 1738]|uniref:ABC transporter permease n=1 Tax=Bradyrhizobium hereditatis TaxID=2821405 RepID=UPI001CE2CCC8|nr:ABC transporter permease [Bradyrhizobium hereditatis]MCA6115237.1 ABC transporter permease [Bradyrhizobium hereditatis]
MSWFLMRAGRALLTLFVLLGFAFFTLAASGDPAVILLGPETNTAALEAFRQKWGLGLPLWRQFAVYVDGLVHLNFGLSYRTSGPALDLVLSRVPASLCLVVPTIFFSIAVGVPVGFYAAIHNGRMTDRITTMLAVIGLAVPPFLLGILLIYIFSIWLGWLPPSGYVDWRSYIMPVGSMSAVAAAIYARFTRSAVVEVMANPMIETAKASGLTRELIHRAHALPNALLPLITITALEFGGVLTFAAVTENVFGWHGVGSLLIESVAARDYAVVETILLCAGTTMILANFLADLSYGFVDPRIRDSRRSRLSTVTRLYAEKSPV